MALFPIKVRDFLSEVEESDDPTENEQQEALKLLANSLQDKYVYLNKANKDLDKLAAELEATKTRMQDIQKRLNLTIKSGMAGDSVH